MKPLTATELLVVFVLAAALSASFQPSDDPPPAPAVVFTQPAGIDRYQALVELGVLEARHGQ